MCLCSCGPKCGCPSDLLGMLCTAVLCRVPAGQQLMAGLGLVSDVSDTQQLLAWLEGRPRERFGIVLTHIEGLLGAPTEEQQGFLDLLDNILHVSAHESAWLFSVNAFCSMLLL